MTSIEIKRHNHHKITQFLKKSEIYLLLCKTFCAQNKREKKKKRLMKGLLSFPVFFVQPFLKPFFHKYPRNQVLCIFPKNRTYLISFRLVNREWRFQLLRAKVFFLGAMVLPT